jgi:hypothetical protein
LPEAELTAGLEVPTAVAMKSTDFWVVMTCSSQRAQRFRVTYRFHLQGRIVSIIFSHNVTYTWTCLVFTDCLFYLFLYRENGGSSFLSNFGKLLPEHTVSYLRSTLHSNRCENMQSNITRRLDTVCFNHRDEA